MRVLIKSIEKSQKKLYHCLKTSDYLSKIRSVETAYWRKKMVPRIWLANLVYFFARFITI